MTKTRGTCSVEGCSRPHFGHGLCNAHYLRRRRHGSATSGGTGKGETRAFLDKALLHQSDDCLLWPFARCSNGHYGAVGRVGKMINAHVVVCETAYGPKPSSRHEVAHSCGVSLCINPRHLRWATRAANHADKVIHGTYRAGERHPGAKLTATEVRLIRSSSGKTRQQLAAEFGVTQSNIGYILRGKSWLVEDA